MIVLKNCSQTLALFSDPDRAIKAILFWTNTSYCIYQVLIGQN